jgi:hypothetical protein
MENKNVDKIENNNDYKIENNNDYKIENNNDYKIENNNDYKIENKDDFFKKYLHDIRNIKILDKEMINNISNMSNENKMNIIIELNNVIETLKNLL